MKRTSIIILSLWCVLNVSAQNFVTHWISSPEPDSTSQIWFRQTYLSASRPVQASITVTSTGNFELFVNEYNVSTDVMMPYRVEKSDNPVSITYDVTRFLRRDTNVVAVWYAPSYPHISPRQIAVTYNGRTKTGKYFSFCSDENWTCRMADRSLTDDGGESIDGNTYPLKWNSNDIDAATWMPAKEVKTDGDEATRDLKCFYDAAKVVKVYKAKYIDAKGDSVVCDFDTSFKGRIRITLRDAKPGEIIRIGNLQYVCSGKTDEQISQKLTANDYRKIIITGDKDFNRGQIQKVEGLEIAPYCHRSYLY